MGLIRDIGFIIVGTLGQIGFKPAERLAHRMTRHDALAFLKKRGLGVVTAAEELPGFAPRWDAMRQAQAERRFDAFEAAWLDAFRAQALLGNAVTAHVMTAAAFYDRFGIGADGAMSAAALERDIEPLRLWAQARRTPFAWGMLARNCDVLASEYRGGD